MKRLLYKLAFWFLTLSWVSSCVTGGGDGGGMESESDGDTDSEGAECARDSDCYDGMYCSEGSCFSVVLYGPRCYSRDCEDGSVFWENDCECYLTCETDEDCATATRGASDEYGPDYCATIICNKYEGVCWEGCEACFEDKHCEDGQACVHHRCEPVEPVADGDEEAEDIDSDGDEEITADGDAEDTEDETDGTPNR